jgi:hypothetical protein
VGQTIQLCWWRPTVMPPEIKSLQLAKKFKS